MSRSSGIAGASSFRGRVGRRLRSASAGGSVSRARHDNVSLLQKQEPVTLQFNTRVTFRARPNDEATPTSSTFSCHFERSSVHTILSAPCLRPTSHPSTTPTSRRSSSLRRRRLAPTEVSPLGRCPLSLSGDSSSLKPVLQAGLLRIHNLRLRIISGCCVGMLSGVRIGRGGARAGRRALQRDGPRRAPDHSTRLAADAWILSSLPAAHNLPVNSPSTISMGPSLGAGQKALLQKRMASK